MPLPLLPVVGAWVDDWTLPLSVAELCVDESVDELLELSEALLDVEAFSAVLDELDDLPAYDAAAT